MPRPVVALLTDFGVRDHYAGAMKGVILGICPDAAIIDSTDLTLDEVIERAVVLVERYLSPSSGSASMGR